jgi:hypothetical protein
MYSPWLFNTRRYYRKLGDKYTAELTFWAHLILNFCPLEGIGRSPKIRTLELSTVRARAERFCYADDYCYKE